MINTILLENSTLLSVLWIAIVVALGVIGYMLKTASELIENVENNSINQNIQTINKMGYRPEEDDEITGYELAEKPHIEKSGGYINEHLNSIINEK